jgi:outer membrane protein insertion porin family
LATRGHAQSVSLEIAVPGSDLQYYKLIYNGQIFVPLNDTFTMRFRSQLGYGNGFGNVSELPFFLNFYSGGFSSLRGFESSSLGPRGTPANLYQTAYPVIYDPVSKTSTINYDAPLGYVTRDGKIVYGPVETVRDSDPIGGNVLVEGSMELLFPLPFVKDQRSVRTALFIDTGNVFSTNCSSSQVNCSNVDLSRLVYSAGFGLTWITGFGPLTFSIAKPLKDGPYDKTEFFQFSLGTGF